MKIGSKSKNHSYLDDCNEMRKINKVLRMLNIVYFKKYGCILLTVEKPNSVNGTICNFKSEQVCRNNQNVIDLFKTVNIS